MNDLLRLKIEKLPTCPGCYLMKSEGRIIYVGKAVNLKNRVSQYFHASRDHTVTVLGNGWYTKKNDVLEEVGAVEQHFAKLVIGDIIGGDFNLASILDGLTLGEAIRSGLCL